MIGCLKSRGGKVHAILRQESLASEFLPWEICLLDVFERLESTQDLVTMKQAALFKKRKYGLIFYIFIADLSNLKRIRKHLV